jgi:hypothetical protein
MSKKKRVKDVIGIAIYRPEDWRQFREISEDRNDLEATWLEWNDGINRFEDTLRKKHITCYKILVELDELLEYCRQEGVPVNGKSRAAFTAEKLKAGDILRL